jgi:hypothetical protein
MAAVRYNPIAGGELTTEYFAVHARSEPLSLAAQAFLDLAVAEMERIALHSPWSKCSKPKTRRPETDHVTLRRPQAPVGRTATDVHAGHSRTAVLRS